MNGFMRQWWRLGGVLALAYVVLFIVAGIALQGETPTYDDPIEDIRAYWVDDGQTYLVGDFLLGVAFLLLFLPFITILREFLGRAEGSVQIWSRVGYAAGVISIAIGAAAGTFWGALAFADFAEDLSDENLRLLMYLDIYAFNALTLTIGTFILASSLVIALTGAVWRWLGWLGIIIGAAAVISGLGILSEDSEGPLDIVGFIAFIGWGVWQLLLGIAMVLMKTEPTLRPAATPTVE